MKMNKIKKREIIFLVAVLIFIYLPIFSTILFSFNEAKSFTRFTGFSLKWYQELFESKNISNVITTTLFIAIVATIISTILGTFAAIALSKNRKSLRNIILTANNIPVVNPEIVTAVGLSITFIFFKIDRGLFTVLLAHISFCIPYVIITVYPKVMALDPNIYDAAIDLGATPNKALKKVILPQLKGAIIAAAAISFTMSFDDFIISYLSGGTNVKNISIYLYNLKRVDLTINALSTFIFLFIMIVVLIKIFIKNKKEED